LTRQRRDPATTKVQLLAGQKKRNFNSTKGMESRIFVKAIKRVRGFRNVEGRAKERNKKKGGTIQSKKNVDKRKMDKGVT